MIDYYYNDCKIGELVMDNPYTNLEQLKKDVEEYRNTNLNEIVFFISMSQKISSTEEFVLGLERVPDELDKLYMNTYILYKNNYQLWADDEWNLEQYDNLQQLLDNMVENFKSLYHMARHNIMLYGDDEEEDILEEGEY